MNIEKLEKILKEQGQPKFRLEQIKKAIFQDGALSWDKITTLSKDLREVLEKELAVLSFEVQKVLVAKDGQSMKALLKLADGNLLETVLIAPKPARLASTSGRPLRLDETSCRIEASLHESRRDVWSACISSQVGCAMGCKFCATGKLGFTRNLTAEEITDQILFWIQHIRKSQIPNTNSQINSKFEIQNSKLTNIVYMGMGEPFNNWKEVSKSLRVLLDEKAFGFSSRSISVSTSGIPEGIEKLAEEFPQVNLALSLHFADDAKRSAAMPVNQKNNLEKLKEALQKYFIKTKRKVFLEYVMLAGVNDSLADADKLIQFVKSIGKLQLLHVNLIRYNATDSDFKSSSRERTIKFKEYLEKNRIGVTIRKSLGEEIQGACGQLAGK